MSGNNADRVLSLLYRSSDSLLMVGTILRGLAGITESAPLTHEDVQDSLRKHNRRVEQVSAAFRKNRESGASVRPAETF